MSGVHLRLDGTWAKCRATRRACPRTFHLADYTVAAATALAPVFLWPLLEAIEPHTEVNSAGARVWLNAAGEVHRDYDLPAVIGADGACSWYQRNARHRGFDRPAIVTPAGRQEWWEHDRAARASGGPTRIDELGDQYWTEGKWGESLHRDGDLPAIIEASGSMAWYRHGSRHRDDGKPAYVGVDGLTAWFSLGSFHRIGGPALINTDGSEEWYHYGKEVKPTTVFVPAVSYGSGHSARTPAGVAV